MPIAHNLHEGSRSEYLAQYVFSSFGTSIPILHQEDYGIDLYCTLTEKIGKRAWPREHYSVQVKSTMAPWVMRRKKDVRWLVEHPFPLFLCCVDKSSARIRLFNTSPRFYAWATPPLPKTLKLVPTDETVGRCTQWEGSTTFSLSAPIMDFSMKDLLNNVFHKQLRKVLRFWINFERDNLNRIASGIHSFTMPDGYKTNGTDLKGYATQGSNRVQSLDIAKKTLKQIVSYVSYHLHRRGDLAGSVRCEILLRYLFKREDNRRGRPFFNARIQQQINTLVPTSQTHLFRGVDALNEMIDKRLRAPTPNSLRFND